MIIVNIRTALDAPSLVFFGAKGRAHCAHPWAQPFGRLSPCKSSVDLSLNQTNLPGADLDSEGRPQGAPHGGAHIPAMLSVAGTHWP